MRRVPHVPRDHGHRQQVGKDRACDRVRSCNHEMSLLGVHRTSSASNNTRLCNTEPLGKLDISCDEDLLSVPHMVAIVRDPQQFVSIPDHAHHNTCSEPGHAWMSLHCRNDGATK
ncbi:hypothetical protein AMAG_19611 [Allomyces macrogynus ATCC 38327]|uniref:Uncharacterized protein n=1 Tax=Allomyces macrogynus (strain ATCC 38327) TaxID=578462 RepID=A0A0L0SVQ7_ALLM3|nr:hypothetical protein AMAG_19611 [Allomyces macrogynus ATCC 38327]|eukprot:KNE66673.1 hypothetical protein AMAG_19611 [Allomyces macrogynus ATCC 38327]